MFATSISRSNFDETLSGKVEALSCPDLYSESSSPIIRIETHMSWVFLTLEYAYKLKKPVRSSFLDFSTLSARKYYCEEELRLNHRLAPHVYLGLVPLYFRDGEFQLDSGNGEIVDYLVKMIRLPAADMLDRKLIDRTLRQSELKTVVGALVQFYRNAEKVEMSPAQYISRFINAIEDNRSQLSMVRYELPVARIEKITARQLAYISIANELPGRSQHIVDAHGDLRPEHIYVSEKPQIIDCLEFKREFRQQDPVDELAFLALECWRLGSPQTGRALLHLYEILSDDRVGPALIGFYQSHRALIRAVLAIWHLDDPSVRDHRHWYNRALTYIDIAERAIGKTVINS